MNKLIAALLLMSFVGISSVEAGYYRTKNSFTGTYQSTGRTNNMGMRRAPAGYHTTSFGIVQKNSIFK